MEVGVGLPTTIPNTPRELCWRGRDEPMKGRFLQ